MYLCSIMLGTIALTGMEFHAFHGCLPEERREGNVFVVDFECVYEIGAAAQSDCLEDTLDYGSIYDIVAVQMAVPSNLLEHVAARIASAIEEAHPEIERFSVKVSKKNPPVSGKAAWSSVIIKK